MVKAASCSTRETQLSKDDSIEVTGKVVEKFKAGMFAVEFDAGKKVSRRLREDFGATVSRSGMPVGFHSNSHHMT